jgi:hypothetical protein
MGFWSFGKKKNETQRMTRFEALDLLIEIRELLQRNKYGEAMARIGMHEDIFDKDQSIRELMDAFQVRYVDLARYAGIEITDLDEDEHDE